ncbi:hypothetical protein [Methylobacterium variabile]|jgi:hypothetical protein|uniref:hypothetical protein n=1 Tax=Methylobacterium variabile TaxID=298794 RepID=UPI00069EA5B2|nr:hypothetical protein [Methylobacterium variabile]
MSFAEYYRGFAGLGDAYSAGLEENRLRAASSRVGQQLGAGDYTGAAGTMFDAGDAQAGVNLLKLGEAHRQSLLTQQASQAFANGLGTLYGGGGGDSGQLSPLGSLGSPQGAPGAGKLPTFAGGNPGAMAMPSGTGGDAEKKFVGALRDGGLTNPYGIAAVTAYASRESGFKGSNITGSWSDPSESGQAGTSGGILSWRGDRLTNMRRFTAGAPDPVTAQAQFTLAENPRLTQALQNAKSPEEANALMADAWRFAGYNRPGGENAARLNTTRAYLARLNGGGFGDMAPAQTQVAAAGGPIVSGTNPARPPMRLPTMAGGSPDPQADMPGADSREAQFYIPGTDPAGAVAPRAIPQGAPAQIGNVPTAAIAAAPAGQAIGFLIRAAASPNLPDGQRQIAQMLLKNKLDETSMPPEVKEYNLARAQGFTGSLLDYKRELKRPGGPTLLSPGQTVYDEKTNSAKFTAPRAEQDKPPTVRSFTDPAGNKVDRVYNPQTGAWDPVDFGSSPLPTPAQDDTTGIPPGVDPDTYRKELAKKTVAQQSLATDRATQATTYIPILERAERAYEALARPNALGATALGPLNASVPNRFIGGVFGVNSEKMRQEYEAAAKDLELAKAQITMKGQGSITDSERRLLALTLPRLDAADPTVGLRTLRDLRGQFERTLSRERLPSYGQGGGQPAQGQGAPQRSAPPQGAPAIQDLEAEARRRGLIR